MKKSILIWVDEKDKELIKEAAHRSRIKMATWIQNIIVMEAIEQTKGETK